MDFIKDILITMLMVFNYKNRLPVVQEVMDY